MKLGKRVFALALALLLVFSTMGMGYAGAAEEPQEQPEPTAPVTEPAEPAEGSEPGETAPEQSAPPTEEPGTTEPGPAEPAEPEEPAEPGTEGPETEEPETEEPGTDEPATEEPVTEEPGILDDAEPNADAELLGIVDAADAAASVTVGDTVTYYDTLDSAYTNATYANGPSTVKLLKDVTESVYANNNLGFSRSVDMTIDLNQHTWTGAGASALTIRSNSQTANITIKNGTIANSTAKQDGGAIWTISYGSSNCTLTVSGVTFSGNTAPTDGGAIDTDANWSVVLSGCTFTNNTAVGGHGGAVSVSKSLSVTGCTFSGNKASHNVPPQYYASTNGCGGAIFAGGSLTVSGGSFTGNTAGVAGDDIATGSAVPTLDGTWYLDANGARFRDGNVESWSGAAPAYLAAAPADGTTYTVTFEPGDGTLDEGE